MTLTQSDIEAKGEEIFAIVDGKKILPDALNPAAWYGRMMEWSMGNEALKVQTLRFVDVLPALNSSGSVVEHMQEYFKRPGGRAGGSAEVSVWACRKWLPGSSVRRSRKASAAWRGSSSPGAPARRPCRCSRRFARATSASRGHPRRGGRQRATRPRSITSVTSNSSKASPPRRKTGRIPSSSKAARTVGGPCRRSTSLGQDFSALYSQIHPADPEGAITHLKERLRPLFRRAKELGVFINLDMENYGLKNLTLSLFESLLDEPGVSPVITTRVIVIQAYLRDSADDIERLLAWARRVQAAHHDPAGERRVLGLTKP